MVSLEADINMIAQGPGPEMSWTVPSTQWECNTTGAARLEEYKKSLRKGTAKEHEEWKGIKYWGESPSAEDQITRHKDGSQQKWTPKAPPGLEVQGNTPPSDPRGSGTPRKQLLKPRDQKSDTSGEDFRRDERNVEQDSRSGQVKKEAARDRKDSVGSPRGSTAHRTGGNVPITPVKKQRD